MLNVLIPLGGKSEFFDAHDFPFPKPLIEVCGKPMIQIVIEDMAKIAAPKRFIFIVRMEDCQKYHLDRVLRLLTDDNCEIVQLREDTKGAACSSLLAISHIDNVEPLLIYNGDQHIDYDLGHAIRHFDARGVDGGVICFESIHPKWSYVRLEGGLVVESAEKRPISKNAIAGFYYFRRGSDFVAAAQDMIKKDVNVNGAYYVAPVLNEMILNDKRVEIIKVPADGYHSFYSPQKLVEFEQLQTINNRSAKHD